ncbi:transmembrane BAX inhibitor motif containing 1 [Cricetulus griseus]
MGITHPSWWVVGVWADPRLPRASGQAAPPHWAAERGGAGPRVLAQPGPAQSSQALGPGRISRFRTAQGPSNWGFPSALEWPCPIPLPHLPMRTEILCTLVLHLLGATGSHLSCQPMPPIHPMPMSYGHDSAEESPVSDSFSSGEWDDRKVRHTFIRKVYSIISVQLLITVAIIAIFIFVEPLSDFVRKNVAVYYVSYAVFIITYLILACCQGPRRRFPWNIILLIIYTLALGFMTGTISSTYQTKAVIIAMIITAVVSICVTIFSFQTKVDFTSCTGLFCVMGIVLMVTGIVTGIVLSFKYFLAYDTQLILGNRKHTISPEDYILGALQIYTDIVYIFTYVLQLMGNRD